MGTAYEVISDNSRKVSKEKFEPVLLLFVF